MPFLYLIVGTVMVVNFLFMLKRRAKTSKMTKQNASQRLAAQQNREQTAKRLELEQEEAARFVERQNRTLEMYEECRERHKNDDT